MTPARSQVVRDAAPRFEHRLFLSATPYNGHSNSFSAQLEILDPQRFNRGVKVERGQLDKVMVRRLKADLRELGVEGYPVRRLVQLDLAHEAGRKLDERGALESEALRALLRTQKSALQKALGKLPQLTLAFSPAEPRAREQIRQIEQDRHAMEDRLLAIDREIETEPAAIQELYRVTLARREPVGMVYLWPGVRG